MAQHTEPVRRFLQMYLLDPIIPKFISLAWVQRPVARKPPQTGSAARADWLRVNVQWKTTDSL
eukprot:101140-Karenia_brevis.AAC.1